MAQLGRVILDKRNERVRIESPNVLLFGGTWGGVRYPGSPFFLVVTASLGTFAGTIVYAVAAIRSTRRDWMVEATIGLLLSTAIASMLLNARLRTLGARRVAERGEVLIEAIHRYRAREGKLPSSLGDLVSRDRRERLQFRTVWSSSSGRKG